MPERKWNADNNLWYEDGEPVPPEELAAASSVQEITMPVDSGEVEELRNQLEELKRLFAGSQGADSTAQATDLNADDTASIDL